jgi:hypothetical protein
MPVVALEADEGPYRLRDDAVWPPRERAYGGEALDVRQRYARPIRVTSRLLLPVALLVTLLGAAFLYTDDFLILSGAPALIQHALLATSDLILPIAWYSLHLTNRRYGAPYAFGQLLAGLGILALVTLINPGDVNNWINNNPALSWRAMLAFGASFLFANFVGITFFDAARAGGRRRYGPPSPPAWCSAPSITRPPSRAAARSPGGIPRWCISRCSSWKACCCWPHTACCGPQCGHSTA